MGSSLTLDFHLYSDNNGTWLSRFLGRPKKKITQDRKHSMLSNAAGTSKAILKRVKGYCLLKISINSVGGTSL